MNSNAKILIFGAGVIGSIYTVRFIQSGFDVTILARGERFHDLKANGLRYSEKGEIAVVSVNVIDMLDNDDIYDFIFVPVRYDQLESALTTLKDNKSPHIVTLANTADYDRWTAIVGDRLIPGFPAAGGDIKDGILYAKFASKRLMGTVFGEINGQKTKRIKHLANIFEQANLPYEIEENVQAFHLTHSTVVASMRNFYTDSGMVDMKTAKSSAVLGSLAKDIKDNFAVLEKKQIPITPASNGILKKMPNWLIVFAFRFMLLFPFTKDVVMGNHAQRAKDEALQLHQAFRLLQQKEGIK